MKTKKHLLILLLLSVFLLFGTGCRVYAPQHHSRTMFIHTNPNGKIPPGQMKKMTGAKSAKQYAPGQVKKHNKGR